MFDFGFAEIVLLALVVLVVIGPGRLPEVMRTIGLWIGRLRRMYTNVRLQIDREIGMDDIRRQLHNEQVMAELKAVENEAKELKQTIQAPMGNGAKIDLDLAPSAQPSSSKKEDPPTEEETKVGSK